MNMTLTEEEMVAAINMSMKAASNGVISYINQHGEHWPYGFAWVVFKNGRGKLAKILKTNFDASKCYGQPGVQIWGPGGGVYQSMDAKVEGCKEFIKMAIRCGLVKPDEITYGSRMD